MNCFALKIVFTLKIVRNATLATASFRSIFTPFSACSSPLCACRGRWAWIAIATANNLPQPLTSLFAMAGGLGLQSQQTIRRRDRYLQLFRHALNPPCLNYTRVLQLKQMLNMVFRSSDNLIFLCIPTTARSSEGLTKMTKARACIPMSLCL